MPPDRARRQRVLELGARDWGGRAFAYIVHAILCSVVQLAARFPALAHLSLEYSLAPEPESKSHATKMRRGGGGHAFAQAPVARPPLAATAIPTAAGATAAAGEGGEAGGLSGSDTDSDAGALEGGLSTSVAGWAALLRVVFPATAIVAAGTVTPTAMPAAAAAAVPLPASPSRLWSLRLGSSNLSFASYTLLRAHVTELQCTRV